MKQLVQEGVDYWFYLSPKVYVTSKENIFLYHTESGARLEVTERHLKDLLQAVYEPKNLGVVEFPQELWKQEGGTCSHRADVVTSYGRPYPHR